MLAASKNRLNILTNSGVTCLDNWRWGHIHEFTILAEAAKQFYNRDIGSISNPET
jgi:hypothetical protein